MTLALALVAEDSIIVAADGRAFITDPTGMVATQEQVRKIREPGPGCALLVSGLAELVVGAVPEISGKENNYPDDQRQPGSSEIGDDLSRWTAQLSKAARHHYRQLFSEPSQSLRPALAVIVAGFVPLSRKEDGAPFKAGALEGIGLRDNNSGLGTTSPILLTFNSTTNFVVTPVQEPFIAIGSMGLTYYLLRRLYSPTLSVESGLALAFYCLKEACFQNPLLGGQLSVGVVRPAQPLQFLRSCELLELEIAANRFSHFQREMVQKGLASQGAKKGRGITTTAAARKGRAIRNLI